VLNFALQDSRFVGHFARLTSLRLLLSLAAWPLARSQHNEVALTQFSLYTAGGLVLAARRLVSSMVGDQQLCGYQDLVFMQLRGASYLRHVHGNKLLKLRGTLRSPRF
jgi:hypothetical protein